MSEVPNSDPAVNANTLAHKVEESFAGRAFSSYAGLHTLARSAGWQMSYDAGGMLCGLFAAALLSGPDPEFPLAAGIAGAASLSIPQNIADGREMLRHGLCDFVVNSLDEALRILKNELRKRQPVSVCVLAAAADVEAEMRARGVAPEVLVEAGGAGPSTASWPPEALVRSGGVRGRLPGTKAAPELENMSLVAWRGQGREVLRTFVLSLLPPQDRLRRRWVEASTRFLPRPVAAAPVCPMTAAEREAFLSGISSRLMIGELQGPIEVSFDGETLSFE